MDELDMRVRAVCDLNVAEAREYGGRHEYDGGPQDLLLDGGAAGLARLAGGGGGGGPRGTPPRACPDRDPAPGGEPHAPRAAQLASWPGVIDAAIGSLDSVPSPVAAS